MEKIKLNTGLIHLFSGTYGTEWEPQEYDEDGMNEVQLDYSGANLMKSIARVYASHDTDILAALQEHAPFVTGIKFPGTFVSPREYNFATDSIDFELTINRTAMLRAAGALIEDEAFTEFLAEHYTSRDGFMSLTPNHPKYLLDVLENGADRDNNFTTGPAQALSALLNFLCRDEIEGVQGVIYEDWSCNGYGGLEYTIQEQEDIQ